MSEIKTKRNTASVTAFLAAVPDARRRADAQTVRRLMEAVTGESAEMWGSSVVGFGSYHYRYASGQEGDWPIVGFSPRKTNLVLYIMPGFDRYSALLARLGKHKTGQSCLYLNSLADVDLTTLEDIVRESVAHMRQRTVSATPENPAGAARAPARRAPAKRAPAERVPAKRAPAKRAAAKRAAGKRR